MAIFVGIDLAWGTRNPSGLCVIGPAGAELACEVLSPLALADRLDALGDDIVAAIDAPLIVGPGRSAEAKIARAMGRYGVYAHSSKAALERGYDQGIRLREELERRGFSADPCIRREAHGRYMLEVYPHAAHVVLFSLPRIMAYKAKPGRTALSLSENLAIYRRHLRLALAECGLSGLGLAVDPASPPRGRARKRHEDELDAVTCALAAMEAWRHGLSPDEVIGDPGTGYIAVPGLARDPRFAQR